MNLRQLQIFTHVASTRSMSETARQLFMTQPAVSQTIAELEEQLEVKLFDRLNKKLILTDVGEVLHTYSKRILELVEEANRTIRDFVNLEQGRLRLGASTTIGIYLLPKIVGEFQKKHASVETSFTIDNTSVIERMVSDNQIDLGLVEGIVRSGDIRVEKLLRDELYLICSPNHHWVREGKQTVMPDEVSQEPLIQREVGSGTRGIVENALRQHQVTCRIDHVLNNTEAIKKAVEADIGIAFVSKLAVQEELQSGKLVRIRLNGVTMTRELYVIFHKDKYRSPLFESFLHHLEAYQAEK